MSSRGWAVPAPLSSFSASPTGAGLSKGCAQKDYDLVFEAGCIASLLLLAASLEETLPDLRLHLYRGC